MIPQSSTYSFKGDVDIRRASKQIESAGEAEAEEIKRVTSYKWSPLNADRTLCADENGKEANTFSAEHIDRLILLTSKARSWRSQDDEAVDITEPRFESFCMENTIST